MLQASLAPSTVASYRNALKHFTHFHNTFHTNTPLLPASLGQVAQFIAFCKLKGLQPSTITSYISALAYIHKIQGLPNPTDHFIIRKLLYGVRKNKSCDKRKPFTLENLKNLITALQSTVDTIYLRTVFKAMFLTAFYGLFRVGELSISRPAPDNVITFEAVSYVPSGHKIKEILISMDRYKHSQGHKVAVPLRRQSSKTLCPVRSLVRYMQLAPNNSGALFQDEQGHAIQASQFRTVLRACVVACGLDPLVFTGHSFRIGGATLAFSMQMPSEQIKRLGRWKSSAFLKYIRPTSLTNK